MKQAAAVRVHPRADEWSGMDNLPEMLMQLCTPQLN